MEMQGIASSFRAGAAAEKGSKRKSKGASGDGGATATAAGVGTPLESFGARRVGGESVIRVCSAEDLAEVFDPAGFNNGLALGEVERVVMALPELRLPFDATDVAPTRDA